VIPPPDPPGIGNDPVVVAPLQNVFSTIATSVGPAGVKVTVAGSGAHVIVGEDVVQPKVTVPLKPGVDVSTIPIANVPPGGTGGKVPPAGGVTAMEIGEFETVSRVDPVTSFNVAEIVVVKPALPPTVTRPAALIVAASVLDDAQVTVAVMSFVLLSEKVPVAVNCTDELIGSVGFAGVTAIDFNVAAAAVNVAVTVSAEAGIVNVQVAPATVHEVGAPFHPANVEPFVTACVNTTCVPAGRLAMHAFAEPLVQLIPLPVTIPVPVPAVTTVNGCVPPPLSMTVESEAFAGAEPPPVTPTMFTCGDVASAATFTLTVIAG
jgi:hypothetical protein